MTSTDLIAIIRCWNPTAVGLAFDIVGFLLVFAYGGFNVGVMNWVGEESKSHPVIKLLGATLVVVGFSLQIFGAIRD